MSVTAMPEKPATPKVAEVVTLKTQKVDIVSSLLLSLLYIVGLVVFLLFVLWLTENFTWKAGDLTVLTENVAGRGDHADAGWNRPDDDRLPAREHGRRRRPDRQRAHRLNGISNLRGRKRLRSWPSRRWPRRWKR